MDPAPIRRWNSSFIVPRWRHLFWGVPLLGLLAGLVVHFLPMIRGTATGVVQLRPALPSTSGLPVFGPSDVAPIIRSDELILQTVLAIDLPQQCKLMERPLIIHQAPGTPVSVTLWDTLRPLIRHPPSAIRHPPSAIRHPPSAICHRPPKKTLTHPRLALPAESTTLCRAAHGRSTTGTNDSDR